MDTRICTSNEKWSETVAELMPLIRRQCRHAAKNFGKYEEEDFWTAATLATKTALDTFDESRGTKFTSYLITGIRRAIMNQLRRTGPVPHHVLRKFRATDEAREQIEHRHCRAATEADVVTHLGHDRRTASRWRVALRRFQREPLDYDGSQIVDGVGVLEHREILKLVTEGLSVREHYVLRKVYGEHERHSTIARQLGITRSRVGQIIDAIRDKLQARIDATDFDTTVGVEP